MKRVFLSLLILIYFSSSVLAGDNQSLVEDDGGEWQEIKVEMERDRTYYVRLGIGPKIGLLHLNLDKINELLDKSPTNFKKLDNNMVAISLEAVGGRRKGNRYGGCFLSGETTSKSTQGARAGLILNYLAIFYEKGIYVKDEFDFAVGSAIGIGKSRVELLHHPKEKAEDGFFQADGSVIEQDFFLIEPRISMHQQLTPLCGWDLTLSYLFTYNSNEEWSSIGDSCDSSLGNISAPVISFRFTFGI